MGNTLRGQEAWIITADASKVSAAQFLDAVFGATPEMRDEKARLMREQCIAAIERGDTYGWPPLMVAECRKLMVEPYSELKRTGTGGWL